VSKLKSPTLILHGTKDTIVVPEDGELLSRMIPNQYLYEFCKIIDGDHNDIIKNHKTKVYKKLREFLNHATKKNFSLDGSESSKVDINSDFFKKLQPPERNIKNYVEENFRSIIIRNFIEVENKTNAIELALSDLNSPNEDRNLKNISYEKIENKPSGLNKEKVVSKYLSEPGGDLQEVDIVIEVLDNSVKKIDNDPDKPDFDEKIEDEQIQGPKKINAFDNVY
jgi:hypothetical protein